MSMNYFYFGQIPTYQQKAALSGSKYGVVTSIFGQGVYRVNLSGQTVTAQSKVGAVPIGDAVIVQKTGAGHFITSKIGMAEKAPIVVNI